MEHLIATSASTNQPDRWRSKIEPLNAVEEQQIADQVSHYPQPQAATIEALKIVQQQQGWVSDGKLKAIAERLNMSPDQVDSVATFYNKIYRRPVGNTVITLCDSISCWIMGYEGLREAICRELQISLGQTTSDQQITLLPTPCLGACNRAPAVMVGEELHGPVSAEQLIRLAQQTKEAQS